MLPMTSNCTLHAQARTYTSNATSCRHLSLSLPSLTLWRWMLPRVRSALRNDLLLQEKVERLARLGKGKHAPDHLWGRHARHLDADAARAGLVPFRRQWVAPAVGAEQLWRDEAPLDQVARVQGPPEVFSTVTMPPMDTVKNSSTDGPMPSSGPRTVFERHTPAKKKSFSMAFGRHAAHPITGTAVSAATYCLKTAVFLRRARQIMPGVTVAHSWKAGLCSTVKAPLWP